MNRKLNEQQQVRRDKLKQILDLGFNVYYSKFKANVTLDVLVNGHSKYSKEELEEKQTKYLVQGRIMLFRLQGKACFLTIKDYKGKIQVYLRQDNLTEKEWSLVQLLDIGDIVGITGPLMKTKVGELTLRAKEITIITKCLRPLPDKFKGLEDIEEIYRRRYLDLIMNDESKDAFLKRVQIISKIREYLNNKGFLEVETPTLVALNSGAAAKPFKTKHNTLDMNLNLRIATELPLKKLVVGGFDKVYELGRIFRNEGISNRHNPEFTSVEIYEAFSNMQGMIDLTEDLVNWLANEIHHSEEVQYGDMKINLKKPFQQIEMNDLILKVTKIDFNKVTTIEKARKLAKDFKIPLQPHWDKVGYIMNAFFEEKCEQELIQPTFITGYPIEVSPLAKLREGSTNITDRFELFIGKREYANGYSELNDADEQYHRFVHQLEEQSKGNEEASDLDMDFVEALEVGMPPTGGLGIGILQQLKILFSSHY